MIGAELRSLLSRKLRTALTIIAIVLGVSMISGTFVLTDTINQAFGQIFTQANRHIDAVIVGKSVVAGIDTSSPTVPASLLAVVRRTSGVMAADGEIADAASLFKVGHGTHHHPQQIGSVAGATLLFGVGDPRFNELTKVAGHWPHGRQIALDKGTITRSHLHLGQVIGVATGSSPLRRFTLVAETEFQGVSSIGGTTLAKMDLHTAQVMTGKVGQYDQIAVMAAKHVTPKELVRHIRLNVPPPLKHRVIVRTAEKQAKTQASQIATALNFLTIALLAFGGIAVFVGGFIIFNTFSITVAQRAREFALLRTIGATRAQVLRSVLMESVLVGVTASILGIIAGLGIAKGLNALFQTFGADLPAGSLVVAGRTVLVGLLVGTIVTVLSAMAPAIRATRVPPIAALREGTELPRGRAGRVLPYMAVAITVFGVLLTVMGIFASIPQAGQRLALIGFGCALLFVGVAMFSPKLVGPLAAAIGWPIQRFTRITGRLARENAVRNPSRTAITAAALMVGLALVGFVTIFAAELRTTAEDIVNRNVAGTYIIQNNGSPGSWVPPQVVNQIGGFPGVSLVSPLKEGLAKIDGKAKRVDGVDLATFRQVYRFQWKSGAAAPKRLGTNGALLADSFASSRHLHVGESFAALTEADVRAIFTVRGIFKASQLIDDVVIPITTFRRDWNQPRDMVLVVNAAPGVNQKRLENRIDTFLATHYPALSISSQAQFKAQQDKQVNSLLALVYVLLGLSIVVSLFGIINTLVLAVYERTREIGMLRAIGATRSQIRWTIRWESVITSVIGAILGLILGIVLAVLITAGLQSQGIEYAFPLTQLLLWVVFAIVFGIVAAAFPARRAARLDVLQAIAYE